MQAVSHELRRARSREKISEKKEKKYLTNPRKRDKITKLSSEDRRWASGTKKDFEKSRKKCLTSSRECGKIIKLSS